MSTTTRGARSFHEKSVFAVYNNYLVRKVKQSTSGTSWLNHSLVQEVAMTESKKLFADWQKGEADHLQGESSLTYCRIKWQKGRKLSGLRIGCLRDDIAA
jgi:hypothetical protein